MPCCGSGTPSPEGPDHVTHSIVFHGVPHETNPGALHRASPLPLAARPHAAGPHRGRSRGGLVRSAEVAPRAAGCARAARRPAAATGRPPDRRVLRGHAFTVRATARLARYR